MRTDFSEIVAIVARGEKAHTRFRWELGDALIQVIGRPNSRGDKDGSFTILQACSEELKLHGHDYEADRLREIRWTAYKFPNARRRALPFEIHREAGDPEMLDAIIEGAPRNQNITRLYVRKVLQGMALDRQRQLDTENARRREEAEKARREREAAEAVQRTAQTDIERKAAADRAEAAGKREKHFRMPPKKLEVPKPKAEDMPILVARAAFNRDLGQIELAIDKLRETYEPLLSAFPEADIENGHERLMTIAEAARKFAGLFRRNGTANHLSVVGE